MEPRFFDPTPSTLDEALLEVGPLQERLREMVDMTLLLAAARAIEAHPFVIGIKVDSQIVETASDAETTYDETFALSFKCLAPDQSAGWISTDVALAAGSDTPQRRAARDLESINWSSLLDSSELPLFEFDSAHGFLHSIGPVVLSPHAWARWSSALDKEQLLQSVPLSKPKARLGL